MGYTIWRAKFITTQDFEFMNCIFIGESLQITHGLGHHCSISPNQCAFLVPGKWSKPTNFPCHCLCNITTASRMLSDKTHSVYIWKVNENITTQAFCTSELSFLPLICQVSDTKYLRMKNMPLIHHYIKMENYGDLVSLIILKIYLYPDDVISIHDQHSPHKMT